MRTITTTIAVTAAAILLTANPATAAPRTTVTLNVEGCEGCVFVVHNGKNSERAWDEITESTPVTDGQTTFRVRRKITPYISLEVKHPLGYSSENAVPFVAFGWHKYSTQFPDAKGWYGDICWGKRKTATATLNVVVTEYPGAFPPGTEKQTFIRARLAKLPKRAEAGVNGTPGCPMFAWNRT